MKKIGIMTGGADCPGLNSVIRAVVRKGMQEGYVVTGIKNGWLGLIENDMRVLDIKSTTGILDKGGTILLGTSRVNPLQDEEQVKKIKDNYARSGMDALIVVLGGEDTIKIALNLHKKGIIQAVAVPKSIDNALSGTEYAFGFDTAVNIATECIDRLHTTAESHHRIMVVEVMGLYTGWLAVQSGIAGGADIILAEIPVNLDEVYELLRERHKRGKPFSIIVISEGTKIDGYTPRSIDTYSPLMEKRRFGSVGEFLAKAIEDNTSYETRVSVLGYILRGGSPTAFDRVLGTRLGVKAVELVKEHKFGKMASLRENKIRYVDMEEAVSQRKLVNMDLIEIANVFSTKH